VEKSEAGTSCTPPALPFRYVININSSPLFYRPEAIPLSPVFSEYKPFYGASFTVLALSYHPSLCASVTPRRPLVLTS